MIIVSVGNGEQGLPFGYFFPLYFLGLWLFIAFTISRVGGWSTLDSYYCTGQPFFGTLFRSQAASFRYGAHYNGCLNFGTDSNGLYLVPTVLFRAFHSPLFILWSDITTQPIKLWLVFNFVELRFQRAPNIPVRIRTSLAHKLFEGSNGRFSVAMPVSSGM